MTQLPTLSHIEAAAQTVYAAFSPTPQYRWATLSQRLGTDCWVKHENHTPVGAFKVRGGLTYFEHLRSTQRLPQEVISATRATTAKALPMRLHGTASRAPSWSREATPSKKTPPCRLWALVWWNMATTSRTPANTPKPSR